MEWNGMEWNGMEWNGIIFYFILFYFILCTPFFFFRPAAPSKPSDRLATPAPAQASQPEPAICRSVPKAMTMLLNGNFSHHATKSLRRPRKYQRPSIQGLAGRHGSVVHGAR